MSSELESKLNDISMLLLMSGGEDEIGLDGCVSLIEQLRAVAAETQELSRLVESAAFVEKKRTEIKSAEFATLVEAFISAAQGYLAGSPSVRFPNERGEEDSSEFGSNYSAEFVPEFIEKHTSLLEEFEGRVMDLQFTSAVTPEDPESFDQFVRKYLHNVKGDAGSIGLIGVERVTHELEEFLMERRPSSASELLIVWREWLGAFMRAIAEGRAPTIGSSQILSRLLAHASKPKAAQSKVAPATASDEVKPASVSALGCYELTADPELFAEFKAEAEDHLENVESVLLESGGSFTSDAIDTIFRGVHSLKGASAYFNLVEMKETSHFLENLLDQVRDGKRSLDPQLVSLTFRYIDLQKRNLKEAHLAISADNKMNRSGDAAEFLRQLEAYQSGKAVDVKAKVMETTSGPVNVEPVAVEATPAKETPAVKEATPAKKELEVVRPDAQKQTERLDIKSFVKVDTLRLDRLLDSIGEMVVYSSMLIRSCQEMLGENESVMKTSHQVEKISRELQDIGMSMRLDPIKGLFQKMSRLVWDVSKKIGKEVNFTMTGEETELDRTVIEKLADPLMHMVRNAIDHGIETPDEREKAGKPRAGFVELSATHAGGSIVISIRDDGRGLDPEKLTKKAIEKGVIPPGTVLSDQEAFRLIFAPGFSTAQVVTDISGRGVGMDVVRNNIEGMRGQIRIESEVGRGSVFSIELPLTLAIIDGVETVIGDERYIIPTLSVLEFMKPLPGMITTAVGAGETFHFRGSYLPLYRLSQLLEIRAQYSNPADAIVVVVESAGEQVALMVDDIVGSCQTVIKSLGRMFDEGRGFAGCAIMPNGSIGLILDVRSIVQLARAEYRSPIAGKLDSEALTQ